MSIRDWWPWARERRTNELADELRAHLDMAQADRVARGETPWEAAANARREFGNPGLALEVARDEWGRGAMAAEQFGRDVRFALRLLRRAPGVAGVAIVTMALGIASTTAIYSLVAATLLHPLPYPRAEQLVRIEDDLAGIGARDVGMSTPEWRDLQRAGVFQYVSPSWFDNNNLTGLAHAQRVVADDRRAELFHVARRETAARHGLRSFRSDARIQRASPDQRCALERFVRRQPERGWPHRPARLRLLPYRRRHAARLSTTGANGRTAEDGGVGRVRVCRSTAE